MVDHFSLIVEKDAIADDTVYGEIVEAIKLIYLLLIKVSMPGHVLLFSLTIDHKLFRNYEQSNSAIHLLRIAYPDSTSCRPALSHSTAYCVLNNKIAICPR